MHAGMRNEYHERLRAFIDEHRVQCEHLIFEQSTHSVAEAAQAAGVTPEDFIKSVCMVAKDGRIVVAIVKGEDRADRSAVQHALGLSKLSIASPEVMLAKTGYPAGGTPPFGFDATFLMDERVFEKMIVFGGGGSDRALVRMAPAEMQRVNGARVAMIRKPPASLGKLGEPAPLVTPHRRASLASLPHSSHRIVGQACRACPTRHTASLGKLAEPAPLVTPHRRASLPSLPHSSHRIVGQACRACPTNYTSPLVESEKGNCAFV
jgi:prolyl-tRNA editing enzyme YbaK/EbsC (Cys-tRNA(Pro) deacylase)